MRVLKITDSFPYPPDTGGKIRVWHLLKEVAQHHEVTLLSLLDSADELRFLPEMQQQCDIHVETVIKQRNRSKVKVLRNLSKAILKGQPPQNGVNFYDEMARKVQDVTSDQFFDIIDIETSAMASYVEFVKNSCTQELKSCARSMRFISLQDVGASQYKRILKLQSDLFSRFWIWVNWIFLRFWEPMYMARRFDKCIVVSSLDKNLLYKANSLLDLAVVPNGVDVTQYKTLSDPFESNVILFVGLMDYEPNVDAVLFFYHEILPLIKSKIPDVHFLVVGKHPVADVRALASDPIVEVTGYVESVLPYYQRACLSVVPLRAGGGTRLKVLESLALGRPVVSTSIGCEGLRVKHNENIRVADTPADFSDEVVGLLRNPALRRHLAHRGRELVEAEYDWRAIAARLLSLYDKALCGK